MPAVWKDCFGVVEVKRSWCGNEAYFTLKVDGKDIQGILTGIEIEMSGNYQFQHTVNNFIYFYAFGDRMGAINVTGIGFVKTCSENENPKKGELLSMYDYYMENRAAASGNKSASMTISSQSGGSKTLRGFLTGMRMDIKASETMGTVGYWSFRFEVVPEVKARPALNLYAFGSGTGGAASAGAGATPVGGLPTV